MQTSETTPYNTSAFIQLPIVELSTPFLLWESDMSIWCKKKCCKKYKEKGKKRCKKCPEKN
jgi:hypothetical protein